MRPAPPKPRAATPRRLLQPARLTADVSLDHLVGTGEELWGDREAELFGRLQVDKQLEDSRLDDRHFCGPFAIKNSSRIDADLTIELGPYWSIAHQPTVLDESPPGINGRDTVARCQRHDLLALLEEKSLLPNH